MRVGVRVNPNPNPDPDLNPDPNPGEALGVKTAGARDAAVRAAVQAC